MTDAPGTRDRQSKIWARAADEWYVEGEDCTTALLTVERFNGRIRDPACGGGNVVRALQAGGYAQAYGTDRVDRRVGLPYWSFFGTSDFLVDDQFPVANIVSNPPFGHHGLVAEAFARRCVEVATEKVALFLPLDFIAGDERIDRFMADMKPSRAYVITPRPSCPPGEALLQGAKAEGGRQNFAWYIWDKADPGPPGCIPIGWARRKVRP